MEDNLECTTCSSEIEQGEEMILAEQVYCSDCAFICEGCYALSFADTMMIVNHSSYCRDCTIDCDNCGDGVLHDDSHDVDGSSWCEGCWDNNTFYCDNCSTTYPDSCTNQYAQGNTYCESCADSQLSYCGECDEYSHIDNACDCNSDSQCCNGIERGSVHSYDCRPAQDNLTFHGISKNKLYLGFELECEIIGSYRNDSLLNIASAYGTQALEGIARLKHDGSIGRVNGDQVGDNGFEIVTDPHTHLTYRENSDRLWDTIELLRKDYNARAWDTQNCGLHVHVSREGFSNGAHMHRFLSLVYRNAPHMVKFAGRLSEYARFNDVYEIRHDEYDRPTPTFSLKKKLDYDRRYKTERMSAVNTQNEHTIELRFFKGTMNKAGVLSALDLTQAMVEYTRELRLSDVLMGALTWEWFADYVVSNNGLYPDLYNRLDKIDLVDIKNLPKINA